MQKIREIQYAVFEKNAENHRFWAFLTILAQILDRKSYLKTLYFLVEFLYLFLENPKNRFISSEIFPKYSIHAKN